MHSAGNGIRQRRTPSVWLALMLAAISGAAWHQPVWGAEATAANPPVPPPPAANPPDARAPAANPPDARAPAAKAPDAAAQGAQVLTRGPVHEAFAGVVSYKPEAGIVVPKAPPANIEEVPPAERPVGNNVTWIPGYWSWDDGRSDFVWVSGTWRALPPGREWIPGYWSQTTGGYQWTSGYWADASETETTYLSEPPATLEVGPNVAAPSAAYRWVPGCWNWNGDRYAWGPGYWARGRANWDWSPSHYVWTPRGYVFVSGYWDYPFDRRGALFAPVYFGEGLYAGGGYPYTPSILLDLAALAENLFIRPNYCHYYFGDYYDPGYESNGFYSALAFQSAGYGYDPIISYQRWQHRRDIGWDSRMVDAFENRRNNPNARPPRTWAAQQALAGNRAQLRQNGMLVGRSLDQAARRGNGTQRFQAVSRSERQRLGLRGQQITQATDQRRAQEVAAAGRASGTGGTATAATKIARPLSPIVAKSPSQLGRGGPPAALRARGNAVASSSGSALPGTHLTTVAPSRRTLQQPQTRRMTTAPRARTVQPQTRRMTTAPRARTVQPQTRRMTTAPRARTVQPQTRRMTTAPHARTALPATHLTSAAPHAAPHAAAAPKQAAPRGGAAGSNGKGRKDGG